MAKYRIAVDTGGTFTDFTFLNEESGDISIAKFPSTPDDPSRAILDGLDYFKGKGIDLNDVAFFCHGTTVGTNALLEEKGAATALVVTEGFTGVYEVMEQARPYGSDLFDLKYEKPSLLATQANTLQARERISADGAVLLSLDEDNLRDQARSLANSGVESVAVCLLFSFLEPRHERLAKKIIQQELPGIYVSLSSDVLPQIREYYRLSTTVINAYLTPNLDRYLRRVDKKLQEYGITTPQRFVMQSNGGMVPFERAAETAVATLVSGPAGGVTASVITGLAAGQANLITFDMGGTSCDVALIESGMAGLTTRSAVDGRHVAMPMMDINTVSAGGGTIAFVDRHGSLHVGPQSSGAVPGPACYGNGGELPTVTDANLVLGYLGEDAALGGTLRLNADAARRAIEKHVAKPLGLSVEEAAEGIVTIVNTKMEEAIKSISTMRGFDLRDFVLLPFGGAGPVHSGRMMQDLNMSAALIPPQAGVFSSLGLLLADVRHDFVRSRLMNLATLDSEVADAIIGEMTIEAQSVLSEEGFSEDWQEVELAADLRYKGQGYELGVNLDGPFVDKAGVERLRRTFDETHAARFGHSAPDSEVEVVSFRVAAIGRTPKPSLPVLPQISTSLEDAMTGRRQAWFDGQWFDSGIYRRSLLAAGHVVSGPSIIEQEDCTIVVLPSQTAEVDKFGNLKIQ